MPPSKLLGHRSRILALLAAAILVLPVMSAQALPCDAYRIDAESLPRHEFWVITATDEAWQQAYGMRADAAARRLIAEVNRILEPTNISLVHTDYVTWTSEGGEPSMSGMLKHLDSSVPAQPGQFVIGLTGRRLSRIDGIAHVGHVHLVVRRHTGQPQFDAWVVAHEIGHLLSAEHHECDHDYRCVMAPKGYPLPARWCAHHLLEIQLGAARLLAD